MASNGVTLQWEGKRAAKQIVPPPVLALRGGAWRNRARTAGVIGSYTGDNLYGDGGVAGEYQGKFALIYLDPPFFTGSDFHMVLTAKENAQTVKRCRMVKRGKRLFMRIRTNGGAIWRRTCNGC